MFDVGETLASDAAREIVKAIVAGLVEALGKVPSLWRRGGRDKQELIEAEIQRSSHLLGEAGEEDSRAARVRLEGAWEVRLRDLLAEDPAVAMELASVVEEIRRCVPSSVQAEQHITASAPGAVAQGAIGGNVINYGSRAWVATGDAQPNTTGKDEDRS